MILVPLETVFLAEALLRHIGAACRKKRLGQIKVHSIFSSSLGPLSFSVREASGPPKTNSHSTLKLSSNKRLACCIIVGII